jgi:hypothetical protein
VKDLVHSFVVGLAAVVVVVGAAVAKEAAVPAPAANGPHGSGAITGTTGKVVETMNSGGYTYLQVDDGSKKIWAAAPQFAVAVGDTVIVPEGMPMRDFQSKTLGKTFDVVYFVQAVQIVGGQGAKGPVAAAHGATDHGIPGHGMVASTPAAVDLSNIKKADGGQTIAELFAKKAALVGKDVAVRGRVVKYTPNVMGKNWIHIQDGSGSTGTNDLTVTTSTDAAVGKLVLVRGKLGGDKDFGFGYKYDILIEDATVTVE